MESLKLRFEGTGPLIMHNGRLSNPLNPFVKEIAKITKKGKKMTEEDHLQKYWLEFQGGAYFDEEIGMHIPGTNIKACLKEGAKLQRLGRDLSRALSVVENKVPLKYKGPRTLKEMFDAGFCDVRPAKIGQSTVQRSRPIFLPPWSIDFEIGFDPEMLDREEILTIAENAGKYVGILDQEDYGHFTVEVLGKGK